MYECVLMFVLGCNVKCIYCCESQKKIPKATALAIVLLSYTSSTSLEIMQIAILFYFFVFLFF